MSIFQCKTCGKEFRRKPSAIRNKERCYCSHACSAKAQKEQRQDVMERFLSHVNKESGHIAPNMDTQCWLWTGALQKNGYAAFVLESRGSNVRALTAPAHRASWILHNGNIEHRNIYVCHRCDVRHCVRPDHLFLGTPTDNVRDCITKGRYKYSYENPEGIRRSREVHRHLTFSQAQEIRERHANGESAGSLSKDYPLTRRNINRLLKGETYKEP